MHKILNKTKLKKINSNNKILYFFIVFWLDLLTKLTKTFPLHATSYIVNLNLVFCFDLDIVIIQTPSNKKKWKLI